MDADAELDAFNVQLVEAIRAAGIGAELSFSADNLKLEIRETNRGVLDLRGCYTEYAQAPRKNRPQVLQRWLQLLLQLNTEIPASFAAVRSQLRMRVFERSFKECLALRAKSVEEREQGELISFDLTRELPVCFAVDNGECMQYVARDRFEKWGVSVEQAMRAVLDERLAARDYEVSRHQKVWAYSTRAGYAVAELLLDQRRRNELPKVRPLVALLPRSEAVLFAAGNDLQALRQLAQFAEDCLDPQFRYASPQPLILEGDKWQPFKVPAAVTAQFHRVCQQIRDSHYKAQAPELQNYLKRSGSTDSVMESFLTHSPVTRSVYLFAICDVNGPILLPEADILTCRDEKTGAQFFMLWSELSAPASQYLEATEHWPPRWRLRELPPASEVRRLSEEELEQELKKSSPRQRN